MPEMLLAGLLLLLGTFLCKHFHRRDKRCRSVVAFKQIGCLLKLPAELGREPALVGV